MKFAAFLLASAALATASPSALLALPADTVDPAVPTQLPREGIPRQYAITVTPHADRLTFDGSAAIDLRLLKPSRTLTLNAADLAIAKATITPAGRGSFVARSTVNPKAQTVTFDFGRSLPAGAYRLDIDYSGKINTQANGLFALDYKNPEGNDARSLFTQFEASDARRFVPSWDEPDYKATFLLTARVPSGEMAVSNMPALGSKEIGGGLKEVRFQPTPVMSSYLLFFATGDFERIAKPAGGKEVGIVMSRGNGAKARYALDAEAQILPYYNDYFGTPFPLPKLDNVAGPGQSQFFGAMENWGAIFTFERALLDDPAISTEANRHSIFSVEAHEMAHQWFGDLVTMAWWNDLWLNEGFASWMENRTTQHFHPDWGADVDHVASREAAMGLDSFVTTHPIVQDVQTVEQANQAFDTIAYQKGESVIGMLEDFAGPDVWQRGIQKYMRAHAYQNSRTADLWAAAEQAGASGLTAIADDFTRQPGVPMITVGPAQCVDGQTMTTLTQVQFSNDRREKRGTLRWRVPVRASTGGAAVQVVTQGPTTTLTVPGCGPLLVNAGQHGYYRTLYTADQQTKLQAAFAALHPVDQYGMMQNARALSLAAYQPMGWALDLMASVPGGGNGRVVEQALDDWVDLYDDMNGDEASRNAIARRIVSAYGPRLRSIGTAPRDGETPLNALLRPALINALGHVGDPGIVAEAIRLFSAWAIDPKAIPGSLKESWLGVAARNATPQSWETLRQAASAAHGQVERSTLYGLLGKSKGPALASRALELAISPEPGKTISAGIITAVAVEHPALALDFVLAHQKQIEPLIDLSGRSRFVARIVNDTDDVSLIPKLEAYGKANFSAGDRKPIDRTIARIRWKASNRDRIRSETARWLAAHPA